MHSIGQTAGVERLAVRLLTRSAAEWVPIAGPVFGVVRANLDVHRADRAAESTIRDLQKP